jgi:hypothetical protein
MVFEDLLADLRVGCRMLVRRHRGDRRAGGSMASGVAPRVDPMTVLRID